MFRGASGPSRVGARGGCLHGDDVARQERGRSPGATVLEDRVRSNDRRGGDRSLREERPRAAGVVLRLRRVQEAGHSPDHQVLAQRQERRSEKVFGDASAKEQRLPHCRGLRLSAREVETVPAQRVRGEDRRARAGNADDHFPSGRRLPRLHGVEALRERIVGQGNESAGRRCCQTPGLLAGERSRAGDLPEPREGFERERYEREASPLREKGGETRVAPGET